MKRILVLFALLAVVPHPVFASGPWNDHAVAFTFSSDDGDRDGNLAWASVFKNRELSFTIFIPSTWVNMPVTKLTTADLRSLHAQGIEIAKEIRRESIVRGRCVPDLCCFRPRDFCCSFWLSRR